LKPLNLATIAALGIALSMVTLQSHAEPRDTSERPGAAIDTGYMCLVDYKEELNKIKKKLHKDSDKPSDNPSPSSGVRATEQQSTGKPAAQCQPESDVTVQVTKRKCARGYRSLDFEVTATNKTGRAMSIELEIQAHNNGDGPLITIQERVNLQPSANSGPNSCATKARITKCSFM
jgi:hypothetical protein